MSPPTSFCGKCGKPLAVSDDRFCRSCGAPLEAVTPVATTPTTTTEGPPATAIQQCSRCGTERVAKRLYCVKCATKWPAGTPNGPPAAKTLYSGRRVLIALGALVVGIILTYFFGSSGGSSTGQPAQRAAATVPAAFVPSSPPDLPITLIGKLTCDNFDSTGPRKCTGAVRNNTAHTINDPVLAIQWKGSEEVEAGTIDINPLLSGQESSFTVVTPRPNPALKDYIIVAD